MNTYLLEFDTRVKPQARGVGHRSYRPQPTDRFVQAPNIDR